MVGVVITEAGNNPKVKSLVYVAAYAPDANQSVNIITKDAYEVRKIPAVPGRGKPIVNDGYIHLTDETVIKHFAQDLPEAEAKVVAAVQGRLHASALNDTVSNPAWKTKPSFYIVADNDHIISPILEQEMAKKIGAETYHVKSSHVAMLSQPEEVSKVILKAVKKL
ncbi:alpha/beta hydrolase [Chryseobacterium wanjuense]